MKSLFVFSLVRTAQSFVQPRVLPCRLPHSDPAGPVSEGAETGLSSPRTVAGGLLNFQHLESRLTLKTLFHEVSDRVYTL